MVSVAALVLVQAQVFSFSVGPVDFSLNQFLVWEMSVRSPQVGIDLNTLVIRSKQGTDQWSSGIMPFKDHGHLALGMKSHVVYTDVWPGEWAGSTTLRVDYAAQRNNGLWHERRNEVPIETYVTPGSYEEKPGQRYIIVPHASPAPKFTDQLGQPVNARDLAYKPLRLTKIHSTAPRKMDFVIEGRDETVSLEFVKPVILDPWIDAISWEDKAWAKRVVYLPWSNMLLDDMGEFNSKADQLGGKPLSIVGAYSLGKPRKTAASVWETQNDQIRFGLQPFLVVFESGTGKSKLVRSIILPSARYLQQTFVSAGPSAYFPADKKGNVVRRSEVKVGMTPEQVWWIMGPPISQERVAGGGMISTYLQFAPQRTVTFKNGKVSEVFIGKLP